jgi:hypothetical protein
MVGGGKGRLMHPHCTNCFYQYLHMHAILLINFELAFIIYIYIVFFV